MRLLLATLVFVGSITSAMAIANLSETVYVETTLDTDNDGKLDLMYVSVNRPQSSKKLSTLYSISPYALGGTNVDMHKVDSDLLPQDEKIVGKIFPTMKGFFKPLKKSFIKTSNYLQSMAPTYARVSAHSIGTGNSTGCPSVGDQTEALAAKSVIDWLNGRARGFDKNGKEVKAGWANGNVGMTGTSYDGTLPIMVATTGVEGLKAIIPVAAISSWYDYYRANGLVVNPGGYIGEDADILGYFIVRKGACKNVIQNITKIQGRENGDFTQFWQERDYLPYVKNIKAATFIIHGQSDWNVKQKHAIQLWEALDGVAPRRMFLHKGGHSSTHSHGVPVKVEAWFAHFLEGEDNGITKGPQVEVELPDGTLVTQDNWPHEDSSIERLYFLNSTLAQKAGSLEKVQITDNGNKVKVETLITNPTEKNAGRLAFLSAPLEQATILTGTTKVSLNLSVLNRKAANITVAIVEYNNNGKGKIITRGWADPQNHQDFAQGELLVPGKSYQLTFNLEPKQYRFSKGSRIGVVVASTDYDYTLRPAAGTIIEFELGEKSFVELNLAQK
ncbi:MAG: CocE/NonD family hydrolase [Bacteriovoracaceae bacterium]